MSLQDFIEGAAFRIVAYATGRGMCPVEEYLDGLPSRDRKRLDALLYRVAEQGPPRNVERSVKVAGEEFWEFKAYQERIFWCYASGQRIVLLHGFTKKSRRTPARELGTGRAVYREVQSSL